MPKELFCMYWALSLFTFMPEGKGQFYHTGTTFFDSAQRAPFTRILLHSSKILHQSGSSGDFGIPSRYKVDTISTWAEGYDTLTQAVFHGTTNIIKLKPNRHTLKQEFEKGKLSHLIPNLEIEDVANTHSSSGETYPILVENKWALTTKHTTLGISPSSNKASYANTRRFLKNGSPVNPHALRIEELVNYFMLPCAPVPEKGNTFSIETRLTDCPWNPNAKILAIHSLAKSLDFSNAPPANLVFLIDNSGSMEIPNRLPLLKAAFSMLVKTLREKDRVAIVTYGGAAGIHLPPTTGNFKDSILSALTSIEAGGGTSGSSGIHLAYQLALANTIPGANNRVILATDGDFNVGLVSEKELEDLIMKHQKSGVKLTCIGVGMGNLKESKIETLARHGNGNYAYLDDEQEAEKFMVKEFSQNLYSVASNLTIDVQLNPQFIQKFKIVGYENRLGAISTHSSKLVGGEVGSGFPLNIFIEVILNHPLEYPNEKSLSPGTVSFSFQDIDQQPKKEITFVNFNYIPLQDADKNLQLLMASAYFGNFIKTKDFHALSHYEQLNDLAKASAQMHIPTQAEFINLIEVSKKIYLPEQAQTPKPSLKIFKRKKDS